MSRWASVLGSAAFFAIAPFTIAAVIPWWITHWEMRAPLLGWNWLRYAGVALVLAGAPVLIDCFARFALQGRGTPAPVAPPSELVVAGLYRHVRNPMYVAVIAIILGQALLIGDSRLILLAALFWLTCHLFVTFYEEPTLAEKFGAHYGAYRAAVPRWIPRLAAWRD